jgi:hypothetical protein
MAFVQQLAAEARSLPPEKQAQVQATILDSGPGDQPDDVEGFLWPALLAWWMLTDHGDGAET